MLETLRKDADIIIKNAIESPLLNDNDIFNARKATIAIYTSDKNEESITMPEIDEIHEFMNKFVDSGFDTKFGLAYVPGMGKKIKITILASGFYRVNVAIISITTNEQRQNVEKTGGGI